MKLMIGLYRRFKRMRLRQKKRREEVNSPLSFIIRLHLEEVNSARDLFRATGGRSDS